jgi:hypothetical protein
LDALGDRVLFGEDGLMLRDCDGLILEELKELHTHLGVVLSIFLLLLFDALLLVFLTLALDTPLNGPLLAFELPYHLTRSVHLLTLLSDLFICLFRLSV